MNNYYMSNPNSKIRIIQHNCMLSTTVMQSLLNSAINKADILFLQEPWISKDLTTITHPTFNSIIPRTNRRPRVITFISKSCPFEATERTDLINDKDYQIIDIKSTNFENLRVINIYNEKHQDLDQSYTIDRLINKINLAIIDRCLLVGDFNAHHNLWNSMC